MPNDHFGGKAPNTILEWKSQACGEGLVLYWQVPICFSVELPFAFKWKHLKSKNDFQKQKTKVLGNATSADLMPPNQIIARCFSALNSSDILAGF